MHLHQLVADVSASHRRGPSFRLGLTAGAPDHEIRSVTDDSRTVKPGALFIARAGTKADGRRFVDDAISRGAVAILGDATTELPPDAGGRVALVVASEPHIAAALIAEQFHGAPTRHLSVTGVTGTNGKTTIAYLLQQFLRRAGHRCGLLGTVETDDGVRRVPSSLTTPGAIELAELFGRMRENGCDHAVMEVSSHALHQERVAAIRFSCGIFTNLTGDHLDYHGTMDAYAAAKAMLFASLDAHAFAIINMDDAASRVMCVGPAQRLTCSLVDPRADCFAAIEEVTLSAIRVRFQGPWGSFRVQVPLVGKHNAINALEAAAAAWTQGVSAEQLAAALEVIEAPPGRLQPVPNPATRDAGFSVLVDYAHTDDALLNVLTALKPVLPRGGTLRVVFGCGGDRDRTKRPRMAAVACAHADQVIVTSDNPRTEDPQAIVDDIMQGVPPSARGRVHVEIDRGAAIAWAVQEAQRGDVVLIAGKGHEDYQIIGTEKRSFDDRVAARDAMASRIGLAGGTR
ncbi:MAG: UDP-N-acetylmuramoyl-L-alanyl-D-glutamate--2,6-diaminopimelate ligase [Phycisphaerae bacterium]|nr:UDP-N-acetylmuramoyl-L-alanyl-D-glutamate--2,6-diaminopimelate ligase [Phycisphaerae bacterium]